MKKGDIIEAAIWIDGTETKEQREMHKELIKNAIRRECDEEGFIHGPLMFFKKRPGQDRVPPVPKHIEKAAEDFSRIQLWVAEAHVIGRKPIAVADSFVANLDRKDLMKLRKITREAVKKSDPHVILADSECDEIIEEIGLEAALKTLRKFH